MASSTASCHPLNYVVTGAGRGIGRGLFLALLHAGHNVYGMDNNRPEAVHALNRAQEMARTQKSQPLAEMRCVDLSKPTDIRQAVDEMRVILGGKIDVLVHNAFPTSIAISSEAMDERLDQEPDPMLEAWSTQMAVGLTAPYLLSRLCVPMLAEAGRADPARGPGCIIHISSTRAHHAELNHEAYSAIKAGLLGLTQSMAASLGSKHGIRVNAILPGWIDVAHECKVGDESGAVWAQNVSETEHKWHWAGRVGRVDDVMGAVEYLASAGFVTGQQLVLDGGVSKRMVYPE